MPRLGSAADWTDGTDGAELLSLTRPDDDVGGGGSGGSFVSRSSAVPPPLPPHHSGDGYGTASTGYTSVAGSGYTGGLAHTVYGGGGRTGGRPSPIDPAKILALASGMVLMGSIMLLLSLGSIAPLEVGLLSNDITAYVTTDKTYPPGLHVIGVGMSFLKFPTTQTTITFTDMSQNGEKTADAPPIQTRTGEDASDPDSGGQPITMCVSLQYVLPSDSDMGKIYNNFGNAYHERYTLIARNIISNVAQSFSPLDFWTDRTTIANKMFEACRDELKRQGMVTVTQLQLLRIDFPSQYEDMITLIQLQVQQKVTKEYQQRVTAILKNLEVMQAQVNAQVVVIEAEADRTSKQITNAATADGYILQQAAKTNATALVASTLGLDGAEIIQYLKLKAMKSHPGARTVIGLHDPFGKDGSDGN